MQTSQIFHTLQVFPRKDSRLEVTGATFGWGIASASYALAAIACLCCDNRPIALSMSYDEFMHFSGKRAPSYSNARLACDKDGKIIAAESGIRVWTMDASMSWETT